MSEISEVFQRLAAAFQAEADAMLADLQQARALNDHSTIKGNTLEETVRTFLRRVLPGLPVVDGEIVDRENRINKQTDVVIRAAWHPTFPETLSLNDGVYAAGEVKAVLNKSSLFDTITKAQRYRELTFQQPAGFFMRSDDKIPRRPPFFLWAFENKLSPATLEGHLQSVGPAESALAMIVSLNPCQLWLNTQLLHSVGVHQAPNTSWICQQVDGALARFVGVLCAEIPWFVPTTSLYTPYLLQPPPPEAGAP